MKGMVYLDLCQERIAFLKQARNVNELGHERLESKHEFKNDNLNQAW